VRAVRRQVPMATQPAVRYVQGASRRGARQARGMKLWWGSRSDDEQASHPHTQRLLGFWSSFRGLSPWGGACSQALLRGGLPSPSLSPAEAASARTWADLGATMRPHASGGC
jgi:hypothetical protein